MFGEAGSWVRGIDADSARTFHSWTDAILGRGTDSITLVINTPGGQGGVADASQTTSVRRARSPLAMTCGRRGPRLAAALENGKLVEAEEALARVAAGDAHQEGTRVALDLLKAIRRSQEAKEVLGRLSQTSQLQPQPTRVVLGAGPAVLVDPSWERSPLSGQGGPDEPVATMNQLAAQYVGASAN